MVSGDQPTTLYRLFDAGGALLYVGISGRWVGRLADHATKQGWWDQVATITRQLFPSRSEALGAERTAIASEHPRYNVQGNDTPPARPDRSRPRAQPPQLSGRQRRRRPPRTLSPAREVAPTATPVPVPIRSLHEGTYLLPPKRPGGPGEVLFVY